MELFLDQLCISGPSRIWHLRTGHEITGLFRWVKWPRSVPHVKRRQNNNQLINHETCGCKNTYNNSFLKEAYNKYK